MTLILSPKRFYLKRINVEKGIYVHIQGDLKKTMFSAVERSILKPGLPNQRWSLYFS